jgi:hypothetical protein
VIKPRLSGPRGAIAILITLALPAVPLSARQNPLNLFRGDKDVKYTTYKDPGGRFELEYPAKDWHLFPSAGSNLAVFSAKDGPTLFIESVKLTEALTPAEVDALLQIELGRLKDQPSATDFSSGMLDGKSGHGVLIRYSRMATEAQIVLQYSIPVAKDLYRLNAVVPTRLITKTERVARHMIQSFKASGGAAVTQPR